MSDRTSNANAPGLKIRGALLALANTVMAKKNEADVERMQSKKEVLMIEYKDLVTQYNLEKEEFHKLCKFTFVYFRLLIINSFR
jgi:hypothetical protein